MRFLRQSTTITVDIGPALDSTDGVTAETALSPTVYLSKAGAAQAARNSATAISHDARGYYRIELNTTDTNTLGMLKAVYHETGATPVWDDFMVLPAVVYDALVSGSDNLDVSVTQFGGTNGTFSGGRPEVNATHWGGTAVASAAVRATLEQILGTAITEGAAGRLAAALTAFLNVAAPVLTVASVNQTGDSFARIGANGASLSAIPDEAGVTTLLSRVGTPSNLGGGATVAANLSDIEAQTDDIGTAGAGLTAIPDSAGVTTLLSRIPSALFSGITSLAQWLGLIAGKQTGNSTARTEIRATGAGSGTFDETTDSLEGQRDNAGTAGAGLTAVPWNAAWDAEVQSEAQDAITASALATAANLATAQTSLNTIAADTAAILLDTGTDGVVIAASSKTGMRLSATGVDDILDEVVLGSYTMRQLLRGIAAASAGKLSGAATTTVTIRSADDTKDVIIATVDADGNRSAVTLDLT